MTQIPTDAEMSAIGDVYENPVAENSTREEVWVMELLLIIFVTRK